MNKTLDIMEHLSFNPKEKAAAKKQECLQKLWLALQDRYLKTQTELDINDSHIRKAEH